MMLADTKSAILFYQLKYEFSQIIPAFYGIAIYCRQKK